MSKLSLSSLDKTHLEGKKVLVRVDFNVPLNEDGQITDDELDWDDILLTDAGALKPHDVFNGQAPHLNNIEPSVTDPAGGSEGVIDLGADKEHPNEEVIDPDKHGNI